MTLNAANRGSNIPVRAPKTQRFDALGKLSQIEPSEPTVVAQRFYHRELLASDTVHALRPVELKGGLL